MAKRKRLTSALLHETTKDTAATARSPMAPIAQIAGDTAAAAAFEAVRAELDSATREGRLIRAIPLDQVSEAYMIRDRQHTSQEDIDSLYHSLRTRGQQAPIEVVMTDAGFGLISGWRRLQALRALYADTSDARFATVQALVRQPAEHAEAYVAMVEENEIRADLSFYERARIAVQTVRAGVFATEKQALQTLFTAVSFSKRSKIKSFMPVVEALDDVLKAPQDIPERLGLALAKHLGAQKDAGAKLRAALREAQASGISERAVLEAAVKDKAGAGRADTPQEAPKDAGQNTAQTAQYRIGPDVEMIARKGRIVVQGPGVTADMIRDLKAYLKQRR